MSKKRCKLCGKYKDLDEFYPHKGYKGGLHAYCKHCCKVNCALDKSSNYMRTWKRPSMQNTVRHEKRAQEYGVRFERGITPREIFRRDLGLCGICGEWVQPRHVSIDHKVPLSKGGTHTRDNVQLAHLKCNKIKGSSTDDADADAS